MTEKEYLYTNDLTRLKVIKECLSEITKEHNEYISNDDFNIVYNCVSNWIDKLYIYLGDKM